MATSLDALLSNPRIWRGDGAARAALPGIPSGFAQLDRTLPGSGWPRGTLTEFLLQGRGIGEFTLIIPALARLSHGGEFSALVAPPYIPYAPALATRGVSLARLTVIRPKTLLNALWAAEQCLRSGAYAAVVAWLGTNDDRRLRRLQLAAEEGKTWGVLFNTLSPPNSPALLRLALRVRGGQLEVEVLKRRGSWVAPFYLDVKDALDGAALPELPAAGPLP
ncbi:MAG: translesion DNA synthesis-associated protein ImuA [Betaproteobacteria bacterium]|nr:translesion DNA synthesis-associated protein ImuA [Betaproteobacteria bacterium]